jgi:hypothetical protein
VQVFSAVVGRMVKIKRRVTFPLVIDMASYTAYGGLVRYYGGPGLPRLRLKC